MDGAETFSTNVTMAVMLVPGAQLQLNSDLRIAPTEKKHPKSADCAVVCLVANLGCACFDSQPAISVFLAVASTRRSCSIFVVAPACCVIVRTQLGFHGMEGEI